MNENLSINDINQITEAIYKNYKIDFSNYALSSFMRRVGQLIDSYHILGVDDLVSKIRNNHDYIELFLREILVEDTEMFREPTFWRELRTSVLPEIATRSNCQIWIETNTGEELYTLLIVLKELSLLDSVKVVVTSASAYFIDFIKLGIYENKKMEQNIANFKRYQTSGDFSAYYNHINNKSQMESGLLRNTEFRQFHVTKDIPPKDINLVLMRNKMIYYNKTLQNEVLEKICDSLLPGGFLAIGVKETIEGTSAERKFGAVNKVERIYRKLSQY
jgi:chemotaxis protein methyltransferase CheR